MSTRGWIDENKFSIEHSLVYRDAILADALREQVVQLVREWRSHYEKWGGDEMKLYDEMLKDGVPEDCPAAWGRIEGMKIVADELERTFLGEQQPQKARGK